MLDRISKDAPAESTDLFLRPTVDAINLFGKVYRCESRIAAPAGYAFVDPAVPGVSHPLSNEQIWAWHAAGDLRFVTRPDAQLPVGAQRSLKRVPSAMSKRERFNILRRLRYCQAIDKAQIGLKRCADLWQPLCDAVAEERGEKKQHWKTHYRWWLIWAKAGRDPRALAGDERSRGRRKRQLSDLQAKSLEAGVAEWLNRKRSNYATAQHAVNAAIIEALGGKEVVRALIDKGESPLVGYKTVRAALIKLGRVKRLHHRHGPKEARQEITPVYVGPQADLPLERVETDFKYLGLFVIDDETKLPLGTPYVAGAIDHFSGAVAGFDISFDPPGSASAARLLANVIQRKSFDQIVLGDDSRPPIDHDWPINGVPNYFNLDNDVGFHARQWVASARSLGCDVVFLEPGAPWKKGMIESFWRSISQSYLDMFPGKRLRIFDKPGHDYKPEDFAVVSLKALRTFLTKAVVDVHNQVKDERSGQLRIERYREAARIDPPQPVPPYGDIIELVGCYAQRKATRKGVVIFGMRYNCPDLARYRGDFPDDPWVEVRYSPDDIGSVMIVDRQRGVAIKVPCVFGDYARGLTLHQHRVIRRHALDRGEGGRLYRQHLEAAKADLYQLGKDLFGKPKNRKLRQRMAHYFGMSPETLDRVTAKTVNSDANGSLLDQEDPVFADDQALGAEDQALSAGDEVLDDEPDVAVRDADGASDVVAAAERLATPEDASPAPVFEADDVARRQPRARAPIDAVRGSASQPEATEPTSVGAAAPEKAPHGEERASSREGSQGAALSPPPPQPPAPPAPPPRAPTATKTRSISINWDET